MIELPNLEFHAAHACNLYCVQCSHYSNFNAGGIVSLSEARTNFDAWKELPAPKRIAILGGEPTLNPDLIPIIELARDSFPNAEGLFVTNGFFLDRHPDLPRVLIDNRFHRDNQSTGIFQVTEPKRSSPPRILRDIQAKSGRQSKLLQIRGEIPPGATPISRLQYVWQSFPFDAEVVAQGMKFSKNGLFFCDSTVFIAPTSHSIRRAMTEGNMPH